MRTCSSTSRRAARRSLAQEALVSSHFRNESLAAAWHGSSANPVQRQAHLISHGVPRQRVRREPLTNASARCPSANFMSPLTPCGCLTMCRSPFTVYVVTVLKEGHQWQVFRRFKEWEQLRESLQRTCGNAPTLPGKGGALPHVGTAPREPAAHMLQCAALPRQGPVRPHATGGAIPGPRFRRPRPWPPHTRTAPGSARTAPTFSLCHRCRR